MRVFLIRHGETDYSQDRRYCGFSDPPLNEKGISQSMQLGIKFKSIEVDRIYSSDLKRADETAKIVFAGRLIKRLRNLREMCFGVFEGLCYEEISKKYSKLYWQWVENLDNVTVPHGESLKEFRERVLESFSYAIKKRTDENIAIVTHSGPIRVILNSILKLDTEDFWQIQQDMASVNIIDYSKTFKPKLTKLNDTSHLTIKKKNPA